MCKIKPTIFSIDDEEIIEIFDEMVKEGIIGTNLELNREQIVEVLTYVECDECLAKDIHISIRDSITQVLSHSKQ